MSDQHPQDLTDSERRAFAALSREAAPPPGLESRIVRRVIDHSGHEHARASWWVSLVRVGWRPALVAAGLAFAFVGGTEVGRIRAEAGFAAVGAAGSGTPTLAETLILEDHERLDAGPAGDDPAPAHRPPRRGTTPATGPDDLHLWSDVPEKVGPATAHHRLAVDPMARAEIELMVRKGWLADEPYSVPVSGNVATVVKARPPRP